MRGRLTFHSETGTEGGYWAFQDNGFISLGSPRWGVFGGYTVFDATDPQRKGTTAVDAQVLREGKWLPLPDPIQSDPDYYVSSLFRGEPQGDREADARLMKRYGFTMQYAAERMDETLGPGNWTLEDDHTAVTAEGKRYYYGGTPKCERPYGVREGELTRSTVIWEDGTSELRASDSLLIEEWGYGGLHCLKDGDQLRIFDRDDPTQLVWEGTIALKEHELFSESVFGYWIHADQEGVPREEWARFFMGEYPAELEKGEQ